MQSAPIPNIETRRLAALQSLDVLDSGPEEEFDALVKVASLVCQVPISLISLIDSERQWFKANIGLPGVSETPRDIAFCAHAILDDALFEVPDATQDPRFFDNPLVANQPDIRFYAGAPIQLADGSRIGTLCVIDRQPRQLDDKQREILRCLALAAAQALEGRMAIRRFRQIANDLAASEGRLRALSDASPLGIYHCNLAGDCTYTNQRWQEIHDLPPHSLGQHWFGLIHPEDRPRVSHHLALMLAQRSEFSLEYRLILAHGAIRHLSCHARVVTGHDETVIGYVGTIEDITQQRTAQLALKEAQERVKLATDSGGIGIWSKSIRHRTLTWDAQVYRLYGLDADDTREANVLWNRHIHPDDREAANRAVQTCIDTTGLLAIEFRVIWPDGSLHHLKNFGRVQLDDNGEAQSLIGSCWDVTEAVTYTQSLQEARDQAEEASKSKGQFLANMSHEIRTPMNAILGMLHLLQNTALTAAQHNYASKTESAAKSLLGLLNDILDFSKVEAGKMHMEHQPFSLEQVMRHLSVVLAANAGNKNMEVLFDLDPSLPDVLLGDAMRLQQVLVNLGGNAVKFTERGHVLITLRHVGGQADNVAVQFAVQDTGIGIAPEHQEHIFSGFSQAEASTTRRFGGTGLGLAISRRLVDMMGGDISIASEPGVGSTFTFTLNLPVVKDIPPELRAAPRPPPTPRSTLIVDDNPVAGAVMQKMLQSLGWTVDLASSGVQALAMIEAKEKTAGSPSPYEVIYMDWHMPDMDGWETTRQLRNTRRLPGSPVPRVIMVSARGRENLAQRSQEEQATVNGLLAKPATALMLYEAAVAATSEDANLRTLAAGRSNPHLLTGMRILVVEDNLINQQVAEELLTSQGALVSLAANGQLGVEAVAAAAPPFDVVLMDIQMPVMDGYAATQLIRHQLGLSTLPIVAMTANAQASDRDACLAAGMNAHVGKPFDLPQLVSLLIQITGFTSAQAPARTSSKPVRCA